MRIDHTFKVRGQFWVLANQDRQLGQGKNYVYVASRTVHIFENAFWYEERTEHFPVCDGHYNLNHYVAICAHIPKRCRHPLEVF